MADDKQSVDVEVSGDASSGKQASGEMVTSLHGIEDAVKHLDSTLQQFNARLSETQKGVKSVSDGVKGGSDEFDKMAHSSGGVLDAFSEIGEHGRTLAIALDAIGVSGGAATAKVVAGVDAMMNAFEAANVSLIAVAGGLAGVAASLMFLDESIRKSGEWNQSLSVLSSTIKAQGGDWDNLKQKVIEFANEQEKFTTYSRDEVVQALTRLTAAGMDVDSAMTSIRVAEDAASATGRSLTDVVTGLMEAEHGRARALTELGIGTRQSIHDGMQYNDVLAAIEKQMGGAAFAAANTLPGAIRQLQNVFSSWEEDAGQPFQDALVNIVHDVTNLVETIENDVQPKIEEFGKWFTDNLPTIEDDATKAFQAVSDGISTAYDWISKFIQFLANNAPAVETFFETVLAIKAVSSIMSVVSALKELALWTTLQGAIENARLLWMLFADDLDGGVAVAIRGLIANLSALGAAEAIATAGLSLIIPLIAFGVVEALQHWTETQELVKAGWDQLVADVEGAVSYVLEAFADIADALAKAYDWLGQVVPGFDKLGDSLDGVAQKADKAADALNRVAKAKAAQADAQRNLVFGPHDTSEQNFEDIDWDNHRTGPTVPPPIDTHTKVNATIGGPLTKKKGKGTPYSPSYEAPFSEKDDEIAKAQKNLQDGLQAITESEIKYKNAVELALTPQEKELATKQLLAKEDYDRAAKIKLLNDAIYDEVQKGKALQQEHEQHVAQLKNLITEYNNLQNSMKGHTKISDADKEKAKALRAEITQLRQEVNQESSKIKENTNNLDENTKKRKELIDTASAQAVAQAKVIEAWVAEEQKQKQALTDEEATYGQSLAAQLAYWETRLANVQGYGEDEVKEREEIEKKIQDIELTSYKQQVDAHKKLLETLQQDEETVIDDIINKHKSMKDILHDIWQQILQDFIKMVEKMIIESSLLGGINKFLMGLFGGSSGGTNPLGMLSTGGASGSNPLEAISLAALPGVTSGAQQYGVLGAFMGSTGANQVIAAMPTTAGSGSSGVSSLLIGGGGGAMSVADSGLVGAYMSQGMSYSDAVQMASYTGGGGGVGGSSGMGGLLSPAAMWGGKGIWGDKIIGSKGTLGGIGIGLASGALFGSMMGGGSHTTWGMVGGTIGGAIFGPVGGAIGGFVGSLFGHADNPAQMPDKYDTVRFGTFVGELLGNNSHGPDPSYGFTFNPGSDKTIQSLGGTGMLPWIQNWISQNTNSSDPKKKALAQQLAPIWGTSGGQLGFGHDIGQEWVIGGSERGTYVSIWNDAAAAIQQIQALGGSSSANSSPVYDVTHALPDWGTWQVNNAGNYTPGGPSVGGTGTGPSIGGTSGGLPPGGISRPPNDSPPSSPSPTPRVNPPVHGPSGGDVHVTIHVEGSVIHQNDLVAALTDQIGRHILADRNGTRLRPL